MEFFYGVLHFYNVTKIFKLKPPPKKNPKKHTLRIISDSSYLSHTKPLFENYNTFNIFQIYSKEVGTFTYKYKNGLLPLSFDHAFTELRSNHENNTRHKTNFHHEIHKMKSYG